MFEFTLNPLLAIAVIIIAGFTAGALARRLGVPAVAGNILAGVALGPSLLGVFAEDTAIELDPVTNFIMGLITLIIGAHLNLRRIRSALRRILSIVLVEVTLTFGLVLAGAYWLGTGWQTAILLAAIATATAPGTVLAVIKEERAKGLMVKTLLAGVALNNMLCILLFSIATAAVAHANLAHEQSILQSALKPAIDIVIAAALGAALGAALPPLVRSRRVEPFTALIAAIFLATGASIYLGVSPLLTNMCMGIMLANIDRRSEAPISALENIEPILLTCFFTLAGIKLHLGDIGVMGALGGMYFVARAIGKAGGGFIGGALGGSVARIRNTLGLALLPQAGLAIGQVVILQGDARLPADIVNIITDVVLATVVLNEMVGPPLVRRAILRAGEGGKDRRRIVEFLQEEFIMVPLRSDDRWGVIRELGEFLIRSHDVRDVTTEELIKSVEERERTFTTAIGSGVALPHARVPDGPDIMGVMGISRKGIDFDAPDGEPVRVVIMIATPEAHKERHAEVLAAVARMLSDADVRGRLFTARDPAEAFEAIETEARHDYNYFLES